jgi:hypothetical protein
VAVHIYTQTTNRTTQITNNVEESGPCPIFASFTLAIICLITEEKARKNPSQVKKTLSYSTVYILPKHTHTHPHILQNNIKPLQYKLKQTQCMTYPNEIVELISQLTSHACSILIFMYKYAGCPSLPSLSRITQRCRFFDPSLVLMRFVVNKVAPGRLLSQYLCLLSSSFNQSSYSLICVLLTLRFHLTVTGSNVCHIRISDE